MRFAAARTSPLTRRAMLLLSRWTPEPTHILLIESGSRPAAEAFLREVYPLSQNERVDLVTCYQTAPAEFDSNKGEVFFTQDFEVGPRRKEFFHKLAASRYTAVCILCTGDPVMTKWKWALALRIPAKILIINENADTFWLDRGNLRYISGMIRQRLTQKPRRPVKRSKVRLLLSRWTPEPARILLVESGSRLAAGKFLSRTYQHEKNERVDVLTCYETAPAEFDGGRGEILFTRDFTTKSERKELFRQLATTGYSTVCILCTGDPVMTKWKWALALRIPAKILIINESADTFWLDRGHLRYVRGMVLQRSGGIHLRTDIFRLIGDALLFPISLGFMLGFAGYMKGRRLLRSR